MSKLRSTMFSTTKDHIAYAVAATALPAVNFLIPLILSNFVSDDSLGEYFLLATVMGLCSIAVTFGQVPLVQNSVVRGASGVESLLVYVTVSISMVIIVSPIAELINYQDRILFSTVVAAISVGALNLITGILNVRRLSVLVSLYTISFYALVFLFVLLSLAVSDGPYSISARFIGTGVLLVPVVMIAMFTRVLPIRLSITTSLPWDVLRAFKAGFHIMVNSILIMVFMVFDRFVIARYLGLDDVAVYSVAAQATIFISLFGNMLVRTYAPTIISVSNEKGGDFSDIDLLLSNALKSLFIMGLLVLFVFTFLVNLRVIYDLDQYLPWSVLALLCLNSVIYSLSMFINTGLHARGVTRRTFPVGLTCVACNAVISISLVEMYGVLGVASATLISTVLYVVLSYRVLFSSFNGDLH